jgi:hypothetical protein
MKKSSGLLTTERVSERLKKILCQLTKKVYNQGLLIEWKHQKKKLDYGTIQRVLLEEFEKVLHKYPLT